MHAHYTWAEVAPLAPLMVPLVELCAFAFIVAICFVVAAFVTAILGTLAGFTIHIPLIGSGISSAIHKAENAIVNALGSVEANFDAKIGGALHELARIVDWTYRELERHSGLIATLAGALIGSSIIGAIRNSIRAVHDLTHANAKAISSTYARVLNLEHRLQHQITAGVIPRLGRLEREYDHVIDRDIAGLRSRAKSTEKSLSNLWDYVRAHPWTIVTDAFVGAVAVALTRLGLNWVKCPQAQNLYNKRGCNLFNDLEGLLAALEVVGLLSLVELAKEEQKVIGVVASGVRDVLEV